MRADSQGRPGTPILEGLKFDLPCDVVVALWIIRPITLRRCKKPARWAARKQCCGDVLLSCPNHRDTVMKCGRCKLVRSWLRWSRI